MPVMKIDKIETSAEVYSVIHARHPELVPFSTYSNPDGGCMLGSGGCEMYTEWGFSGNDYPIIAVRTTWDKHPEQDYIRVNEKHEFYICVGIEQDDTLPEYG